MIINLINTILIACGMAVNTTNFNSVEKRPKRNEANVNYELEINNSWKAQEYETSNFNKTIKWFLGDENTPTYSDNYINIYNTTYTCERMTQYNYITAGYILLKITPYRVLQEPNLKLKMVLTSTNINENLNQVVEWQTYRYNYKMNDLINMTLTNNTKEVLDGSMTNEYILDTLEEKTINGQTQNIGQYYETEIDISVIGTYDYYIFSRIQTYYPPAQTTDTSERIFTPSGISLKANITVPVINYDVVDVPGLMLNILTLPFSFISQAFNLTIFPGTPYSINFSNLFRTIIAIFILLWIIKKIFK